MDDAFRDTLTTAAQIVVGINARGGPHVTPELFTISNDRIWCLTAAVTLKARLLAEGGRVAVAARTDDGAAIAVGSAVVIDALRPAKTTAGLAVATSAPVAVSSFVLGNAAELTGAVIDTLTGKLGRPLPPRRVVLCIEPDATATIDCEGRITAHGWDGTGDRPHPPLEPTGGGDGDDQLELLADIPDKLRDLAASGDAFLGWTTAAGDPLVLPVAWDLQARRTVVSHELLRATNAANAGRAAVTRDDWTGFGPTGKQGVMLRGDGHVTDAGGAAAVEIQLDGATYWDGVATGSVSR